MIEKSRELRILRFHLLIGHVHNASPELAILVNIPTRPAAALAARRAGDQPPAGRTLHRTLKAVE